MLYSLDSLYEHTFENVHNVYDVFKNFFGEKHVDLNIATKEGFKTILNHKGLYADSSDNYDVNDASMQSIMSYDFGIFILVYWPTVTVTNEYDKSHVITDLYAKIGITTAGCIPWENSGFKLNRGSYSIDELNSNYMHSHVPGIPFHNFTEFQKPCLGTGPIQNTIHTLKSECSDDMWMLFCHELALYVTVESISGVPYNRLENIRSYSSSLTGFSGYNDPHHNGRLFRSWHPIVDELKKFAIWYAKHGNLKFSFIDGIFVSGIPYWQFMIGISNCFIDYYNRFHDRFRVNESWLYRNQVLVDAYVQNGKFYSNITRSRDYSEYVGKLVCVFKGQEVRTVITDREPSNAPVKLLHHGIAIAILNDFLNIINYRYDRNKREEESSTVSESVYYI